MLTGAEIMARVSTGDIEITDFDMSRLNPNSYNLRLGDKLKIYEVALNGGTLDSKATNKTIEITIPDEGYVLQPGILYIGSTIERTRCDNLVACIDGRSSIGRLGICIHLTAGFGDVGFEGNWTLEITAVHPVRIYKGMEICQVYFETVEGSTCMKYCGKYQGQTEPTESRMHTDKSIV